MVDTSKHIREVKLLHNLLSSASLRAVRDVRRFNRFYTKHIGVLQEGLLSSPFSLTEVRVLYELAHRRKPTAGDLCKELGLDAGYLSRVLSSFERRGWVRRQRSAADGRQSYLSFTTKGCRIFAPLEKRSNAQVAAMLVRLSASQQKNLVEPMTRMEDNT